MADETLTDARGPHISQAEVADLITDMAAKANAADVYTQTEITTLLADYTTTSALTILLGDYTTTSALTAALADKADAATVSAALDALDASVSANTTALAEIGDGLPVGAPMNWDGPRLPSSGKFKYRNGEAISRTGFPDCFDVLCPAFTGDTTSGSAVISNIDDMEGFQPGQVIEGAGIPSGAVVSSVDSGASTITLDQNATATASTVSMRFFTHGAGDGSTTFNLPDVRGRADFGRDDMGGTAANRLSNTGIEGSVSNPDGTLLGDTGGGDRLNVSTSGRNATFGTFPGTVHNQIIGLQGDSHAYPGGSPATVGPVSVLPPGFVTNKLIKVLP